MIIFNIPGAVMVIVAALIAFGIKNTVPNFPVGHGNGPMMLILGPLCIAFDLLYRWKKHPGYWFHPAGGGSIILIPVWVLGVLWTILGAVYVIRGHA